MGTTSSFSEEGTEQVLGRKRLSFTEMCTVITIIEAILNTRPLTKLNTDDVAEIPLRPIDFLQGHLKFSLPEGEGSDSYDDPNYDPEFIQSKEQAKEALLFSENIANKFWECWRCEYLVLLREIQKQHLRQPRHSKRSCPELGEIVLIEQDLIPRGSWPYGKVVEVIVSGDDLIRSAKILMPNRNIIHRPLNKIYPLEIRSAPQERNAADTVLVEENLNGARREVLPRSSKTRAYEFFRSMEASISCPQLMPAKFPLQFIMLLSVINSPTLAVQNSSLISCSKGMIDIPLMNGWFEICIDRECQALSNSTRLTRYMLPISPTPIGANVRLRTLANGAVQEEVRTCERANFCDHQYLLSKTLLGNPHCWPVGAIVTTAVLTYVVIAMALIAIWLTTNVIKKSRSDPKKKAKDTKGVTVEPTAPSFELTPLPGSVHLAVCTLLCIVSSITACQHGYMRHSADLVCNEVNQCHYEYNRELLFNRLQSELCVEIIHGNHTVGLAKFRKKSVEFKCSKIVEFFTRPTIMDIYHIKRCAQAGSCTTKKCETVKPYEIISELNYTSEYPGYTGCMNSCGGPLRGCFVPLPACWFYRVTHRPPIYTQLSRSRRGHGRETCPHGCTHIQPAVINNK